MRPLRLTLVLTLALAGCQPAPPPAAPEGEGQLGIALHAVPAGVDPHLQDEVVSFMVHNHIYEALVRFDSQMRIGPGLAYQWDNPDDDTWRFYLRKGVRFHDGHTLTAEDVVFSLERARSHPRSAMSSYVVAIEDVRALDEHTIEIRTTEPYAILLNKLPFVLIVPKGIPRVIEEPVGSGPYRLRAQFEDRVQLLAFADYWGEQPSMPEVEIRFVPDRRRRLELLRNGEVDLINEVGPENFEELQRAEHMNGVSETGLIVQYLQVDLTREPFSDLRVRQAIDLALDRKALVDAILEGQGTPAGQMLGPQVYGFAPDLDPPVPDRDRARSLLAEAGYPNGLDMRLEFRIGHRLEALREQLAQVGIRVELAPQAWEELYPRLRAGKVGFYFGGWICLSGDASDFFDLKAHTRDPETGYGDANSNGYSNPELDLLIEQSAKITNMMERRAVLEKAARLIREDLPFVPLFSPNELYGIGENVRWSPRLDGRVLAFEATRLGGRR